MIFTTNALVIKEQTIGESDKLLTLLTEEEGVIRAFASRAKNFKDKKSSATSLLCYSRMGIYKGKDKYIIESASVIDVFFDLRKDINALSLSQYFCEICAILIPEACESKEYLKIALNSISLISKQKKDLLQIKAITELRLLSASGYMPNLVACSFCSCYENDAWFFFGNKGEIICEKCAKDSLGGIKINQTVLTAMRYIIYSEFKKIYSFNIPEKDILSLCFVAESYLVKVLGKVPMTLDFFKTICDKKY